MYLLRSPALLLLALAPAISSCQPDAAQAPMSAEARRVTEAARAEAEALPRELAALPPQCTLGNAAGGQGPWLNLPAPVAEPDHPLTFIYSMDTPVQASTFHVILNAHGWHGLEKVEIRDARGDWSPIWTGGQNTVPLGCDYVRFEQGLCADKHEVAALRLTFQVTPGTVMTSFPGVLPDAAAHAGR